MVVSVDEVHSEPDEEDDRVDEEREEAEADRPTV
jgi:hypothetical protein